ncbi:MAG: YdcF family protein [Flavobacteriales bacterium]|nr:YdcF family protein [Flavobacteriales bacterium]
MQILGMFGGFLIYEDELQKVEVAFILGGNSRIRAERAAEVYKDGFSDRFVCTGSHYNDAAKYFNIPNTEATLTKGFLEKMDVPTDQIEAMKAGTSTREEAVFILEKCHEEGWKKILIISDRFHTRRIHQVFDTKFANEGIEVLITGVANDKYSEEEFWKKERGVVMVIEEYIKMVYYFLT